MILEEVDLEAQVVVVDAVVVLELLFGVVVVEFVTVFEVGVAVSEPL